MDAECPPSSAAKYNRQFPKHTSRADSTSSYVVLRGGETTTPKQGINLLNSEVKAAKQQKTVKKQEERRRKSRRRSVGRDQNGNQVERRALECSSRLCIHRLLQFLVLLFSVAALAIVILMVFGILWPGRCPCNRTGSSQSPIIGEVNQRKDLNTSDPNVPQSTFNLDMSPFYDILDDLKANVTSLRKQAESVMTESETNKGALVTIWTEFSIIEAAINKFSNRLDSAIDHVNQTVHALNPDHSSVFTQIRTLNSTLNNELTKIKQTSEQKNHAINSETNSMNSSLAEKAASKLSSPGPVGDQGSNGFKGPPGIKGSTGSQGAKGDVGSKGQRGDIGSPGDKGSKGSVGSKGSPGAQGSNGLTGQVGNKGSKGNRGEPGLQGIGNFSWCKVKKDSAALTDINQGNDEAAVTDTESLKVISATCSTDTGQEYNLQATKVSSNPDLYKYSCICKATAPSNVNCILYYMECPIYPP
ncbi:uncharacterized protein [Montipora capricornis]|uniref:uncharacterized protein isoform X2 n=1 Tax=Montipora capricornis TaxID=246305 RepID=UPI0035F1864E